MPFSGNAGGAWEEGPDGGGGADKGAALTLQEQSGTASAAGRRDGALICVSAPQLEGGCAPTDGPRGALAPCC